ncbi:hypothetical protein ACJ6V1_25810, partial [Escherichia coli]|uniref:hypothetical protein n=1 Tax=Escherichia coli TaxID=562 RepID=UPI003896A530
MNPVPHSGGFWCCALRPVTQSAYIGYDIHHQLIQNRGIEICLSDRYIPAYREKVSKRAARTVLTGMCYSVGSATRQGEQFADPVYRPVGYD